MKLNPFSKAASTELTVPTGTTAWGTRIFAMPRARINWDGELALPDGARIEDTSIVAAVLGWIARTFPEAPVVVKKRTGTGDLQIVNDHPMSSLIEKPNQWYTGQDMWYATIIDWWLDGNTYWLKGRGAQRRVTALYWAPHWMLEPKGNNNGNADSFIEYYEYRPYPGALIKLAPSEVVHFRHGLDPYNPRKGLGKFKALFREIYTDEEAASFTASLLGNMGVPGMVVSPKPNTGDDGYTITAQEAVDTKLYIKQSVTGDHRGEPLVMRGPIELTQFGFNPEQLALRSLRMIPEERISGVVGVAAIVAGLGAGLQRSTFANYAEAREASYEENIIPSQRFISATLKAQLLIEFEADPTTFRVGFDTSDVRILQEDADKLTTRLTAQFNAGGITQAEMRSKLGYDVKPEHDFFALPLGKTFIAATELRAFIEEESAPPEPVPPALAAAQGQQPPQPPVGGSAPGAPGSDGSAPADAATAGKGRAWRVSKARRNAEDRRARALLRVIQKRLARVEAGLLSDVASVYDSLGAQAARAYGAQKDAADILAVAEALIEGMDFEHSYDALTKAFSKAYGIAGEIVFEEVATALEVDIQWDLNDPVANSIIGSSPARAREIKLPETVLGEVRKALQRAQTEGLGPRGAARTIREEVGGTGRATTIARTEMKYAQNRSSLHAYQKSEVVTGLRAFDNQTGYNDEDCTERDGKVYSFEEADAITDEEHPNGTLSWAPVTGRA